jgi:general secretion pathway protein G
MRQKGFATLEVILMILVIAILASIAVPRFTSVTTAANTAKIQADLSTIDTAIAVYYMDHGEYPAAADNLDKLADYLQDTALKPPSGYAYIKGTSGEPTETKIEGMYKIVAVSGTKVGEVKAALGSNTADKFYIPKKSS